MGLTKQELDALKHHLDRRLILIEELQSMLATVGQICRQIATIDNKVPNDLFGSSSRPPELRGLFDKELAFQLAEGDPVPGSFMASVAGPRVNLFEQYQRIHQQILAEVSR